MTYLKLDPSHTDFTIDITSPPALVLPVRRRELGGVRRPEPQHD